LPDIEQHRLHRFQPVKTFHTFPHLFTECI
jgi:hypothetical protein